MNRKNYYGVLGVARNESPEGIRRAFRDLVREHHPDRAGPDGTPVFREVVEAYRVLSDPALRRAHDDVLGRRDADGQPMRPRPMPRPVARPRVATRRFGDPDAIRPSEAALFDRILRNFGPAGLAKGERLEPLFCDVMLSEEEARRGGVLPIRLPIVSPCAACHGAGHRAGTPCPVCDARGRLQAEAVIPVDLPPGVASGRVFELSLEPWGVRNLWLRVRVRISRKRPR